MDDEARSRLAKPAGAEVRFGDGESGFHDPPKPAAPPSAKVIQVPCTYCGGLGYCGEVTHDMAIDGGDKDLEGMPIKCHVCNGGGVILQEVEPSAPPVAERTAMNCRNANPGMGCFANQGECDPPNCPHWEPAAPPDSGTEWTGEQPILVRFDEATEWIRERSKTYRNDWIWQDRLRAVDIARAFLSSPRPGGGKVTKKWAETTAGAIQERDPESAGKWLIWRLREIGVSRSSHDPSPHPNIALRAVVLLIIVFAAFIIIDTHCSKHADEDANARAGMQQKLRGDR